MEMSDTLGEIYDWVDSIPLSRQKKNIARDFSDAVLMAEVLKNYYPRYVEMHNYITANSISKKIDNWCTLNRKVLSKIGMKIGKETIDKLSRSEPGIIENILLGIRNKITKDCNTIRESICNSEDGGKGESVRFTSNTSEEMKKKTVPKQTFMKLKQELKEKNETINSLKERINHLESIIKLKNERIKDLESRYLKIPGT